MARKERPITEHTLDKILKNTGTPEKPFYAMASKIRRFRIFGVLVFKFGGTNEFPDLYTGKPEIE